MDGRNGDLHSKMNKEIAAQHYEQLLQKWECSYVRNPSSILTPFGFWSANFFVESFNAYICIGVKSVEDIPKTDWIKATVPKSVYMLYIPESYIEKIKENELKRENDTS